MKNTKPRAALTFLPIIEKLEKITIVLLYFRNGFPSLEDTFEPAERNEDQAEVLRLACERAYGITVPKQHSSNWTIRSEVSVAMLGSLGFVDIQRTKQYPFERFAGMQGFGRDFPTARTAFWILEEAKQEGLPQRIPPMVISARHPQNAALSVRLCIDAKTGFSLNPGRWPMMKVTPKPVRLDEYTELLLPEEPAVDRGFSKLDLTSLSKLDFRVDR